MKKTPTATTHPALTRRRFVKALGAGVAGLTLIPRHVLGGPGYIPPSDRITLGFIGVGKQGLGLGRRFAELAEAQILAASDVDQQKLERFQKEIPAKYAENGRSAQADKLDTYPEYEALLAREDIDAVVIATPDHWHAIMAISAMKQGKDVYCEKPLAHTVKEGRAMALAVEKYQKVLQTGSMQRSRDTFRHACELVRNGYIGELKTVLVHVGDPALTCDLPDESIPAYLNWDRWLGPAPQRGYSPVVCPPITDDSWAKWRDYKEYGGGILSDWGAHMFDIAQWGMGMDASGPVRFVPPTDPNAKRGLKMTYANGVEMIHEDFGRGWAVRFIGSEGSLDVSRSFLDTKPENIASAQIKAGEIHLYPSENHYTDWLTCIKNRKQPICDVETGHRSASVCNLANIAYQLGRPLTWDPVKEKFKGDGEANKMRGKKYRKPYTLG